VAPLISHHQGVWGFGLLQGTQHAGLNEERRRSKTAYLPQQHVQKKEKEEQCRSKRHCSAFFPFHFFSFIYIYILFIYLFIIIIIIIIYFIFEWGPKNGLQHSLNVEVGTTSPLDSINAVRHLLHNINNG
jgi:hypothetical protein